MRWLVSLISLIALFAQQMNCCCDSVCAASYLASDDAHSEPEEVHDSHAGHHHHAVCVSEHRSHADDSCPHEDDTGCPAHEHHFCVGTHIFYQLVAVTAAPNPWMYWTNLAPEQSVTLHVWRRNVVPAPDDPGELTHPPRAMLCVLVI